MKNLESLTPRVARLLPLLAVGLLTTAAPTFAQPGGGPGMNDNPPNANRGDRGGRGGRGGDGAAMQARMMTRALQSAGYTDEAMIEAVTTYVTNRQAARQPLYQAAGALSAALADENTTGAQMDALWSDFNKALDAEKVRTAAAEAELDKQIGYTKDSKLSAALTLLGVVGEASGYLNGGQGGRGGRAGMGGPDGMNGGPGGGRGGGRGGRGGGPVGND